ncbi:MAG: hypothetical protein ACRDQ5_16095 [Sciscionella sp.]
MADARSFYTRSIALARELADRLHIALNNVRLGELAELAGDIVDARRYWTEAATLFGEIGVADAEADVARRHLARTVDE